jgi:hypothetical protein
VILGYIVGRILGFLYVKYTPTIDGKKHVNDYMAKNYGKDWSNLNYKQQDK